MVLTIPYTTPLLLRGNGTDGSTTLTDDNGRAVSVYGDAKVSTAKAMFTATSSLKFDGSGDYMAIPYSADMALDGDFTIEAWVNLIALPASGAYFCIASQSWGLTVANNSWYLGINKDAALGLQGYFATFAETNNSMLSVVASSWSTGAVDQWVHIAAVKFNQGINVFVNGVPSTWVGSAKLNLTQVPINIGVGNPTGATPWFMNGYISELRIVRGAALYLGTFTPPTAPLPLVSGTRLLTSAPLPQGWIKKMDLSDPAQFLNGPKAVSAAPTLRVGNRFYAGSGRVSGTVKTTPNTPVSRKVLLLREPTLEVVRTQWSDPVTGAYSFDSLDTTCTYSTVSYDYLHNFRAVIADGLIPEPMP